eukprot:s2291_g1.t1
MTLVLSYRRRTAAPEAQHQHTLNLSPRNAIRDDEDMEAAAEKAAMERGKRLTKRGTAMLNLRRQSNIITTVDTAGTVGFWEVSRSGSVKILAEMTLGSPK